MPHRRHERLDFRTLSYLITSRGLGRASRRAQAGGRRGAGFAVGRGCELARCATSSADRAPNSSSPNHSWRPDGPAARPRASARGLQAKGWICAYGRMRGSAEAGTRGLCRARVPDDQLCTRLWRWRGKSPPRRCCGNDGEGPSTAPLKPRCSRAWIQRACSTPLRAWRTRKQSGCIRREKKTQIQAPIKSGSDPDFQNPAVF